jgi:hypothetical protein
MDNNKNNNSNNNNNNNTPKPPLSAFRFHVDDHTATASQLCLYRLRNPDNRHCYINAICFALYSLTVCRAPLVALRAYVLPPDSVWYALVTLYTQCEQQEQHQSGPPSKSNNNHDVAILVGEGLTRVLGVHQQQDAHEFIAKLVEVRL